MTNAVNIAQIGSNNTTFRNKIINGAQVIDQRNAGASVTCNSATQVFPVDRFVAQGQSADGVFTLQQSTTAPTGFINSLLATVTTADSSIGSTQYYFIQHKVEGFNCADLNWGATAASAGKTAQTVTLSFWVRSSLTGTFGGSLSNDAATRSYPFTYTISAANTWEQKSVTIAGDTAGTWLTDNQIGIRLYFNIGAGSSYTTTAGAWASQWAFNATGATNLIATNGATLYITGVQLEAGSAASPFEYRSYGAELALCQRYYWRNTASSNYAQFALVQSRGSSASDGGLQNPVPMRAAATIVDYSTLLCSTYAGGSSTAVSSLVLAANLGPLSSYINITMSASLGTGGQVLSLLANSSTAYIGFGAEL